MTKKFKVIYLIMAISLVINSVINLCHVFTKISKSNIYATTGVVRHISNINDMVTIQDFNGNMWQIQGVEDWDVGDIVSCVMDSHGTEKISDDTIISSKYSGSLSGWNM